MNCRLAVSETMSLHRPLGQPAHRGQRIGDARRYPVFSARDRRRIAFGPDNPANRKPGRVDAAWRKSADAAGVVILDTEAVDRDGKRGWIVVPAAAAKAILKGENVGGPTVPFRGANRPLNARFDQ